MAGGCADAGEYQQLFRHQIPAWLCASKIKDPSLLKLGLKIEGKIRR
jgi:hypothetical protein